MQTRRRKRLRLDDIEALHSDTRACAERAGLVYIEGDPGGISRRRRGRGFTYLDASGRPLQNATEKERIAALAIPPAWQSVWICADADGHILATGEDNRGRKQYLYHPRWREVRDLINFYRLIAVARSLPPIREHVSTQLRRRSLDRDRAMAGMIALLDAHLLRIGSEIYAEQNDSYGLSTLTAEHLQLNGSRARLTFPAKSGQRAEVVVNDRAIIRLLAELAETQPTRLFTVDGHTITADEVNEYLSDLSGEQITAKDYRTWGGTCVAFSRLRQHRAPAPDSVLLEAVDAAADALGNTRAIAREHYVHPHLLDTARAGTLAANLARAPRVRAAGLSRDERALAGLLRVLFDDYMASANARVAGQAETPAIGPLG
jgi:DNA topoisomerase-1